MNHAQMLVIIYLTLQVVLGLAYHHKYIRISFWSILFGVIPFWLYVLWVNDFWVTP